MPLSTEQLAKKKAQDPEQFAKDRLAMRAFSQYLNNVGNVLFKSEDDGEVNVGRKVLKFSDALEKVSLDPAEPRNRDQIDQALDTLFELEEFLGSPASDESGNTCGQIIFADPRDDIDALRSGLRAFNSFCGFQLDEEALINGKVYKPTEKEKEEKKQALKDWHEQRSLEREETLKRERAAAAAAEKKQQEAARKRQEEILREQEEERRAEEAAEQARREQEEAQRRREAQQRQREADSLAAEEKARQAQIQLRADLRSSVENLMARARDPKTSDWMKRFDMAEALAYHRQLADTAEDGSEPISIDEANSASQWITEGAAFSLAARKGKLGELTALSIEQLDQRVRQEETEALRLLEGTAESARRAGNIVAQMGRTWRFLGNSDQFDEAKRAMQELSGKERISQVDNYVASDSVRAYVTKNLQKATTAVGMTRMACSLAFLKQTMNKMDFENYCYNLNTLRRIPYTEAENGKRIYDVTNPRCIVPEEIGTAEEVYHDARERVSALAREGKAPSPRDMALMTALRTLQAKAVRDKRIKADEDLVVVHEELQEEIAKVQKDPRFQAAMQRPQDELIEMAFGGNIDTLEGYAAPLRPEQQERVDGERARLAEEQRRREDEVRRAEEELQRQAQAEADERARAEQKRLAREAEARERDRQEAEFRAKNKPAADLYLGMYPQVEKLGQPLDSIFNIIDDEAEKEKSVELAAQMVALIELQKKVPPAKRNILVNLDDLQKRVDELKADPIIQDLGKKLREDPNIGEYVELIAQEGREKNYSGDNQKLNVSMGLSAAVEKMYAKQVANREWRKQMETQGITVAEGYRKMKTDVDAVLHGKRDYQQAVPTVALSIALREVELRDGMNGKLDLKALNTRLEQLSADPLVTAVSQSLYGPIRQREMEKTIVMKADREHVFAGFVDGMYKQALAEKQQRMEARKAREAQKALSEAEINPEQEK